MAQPAPPNISSTCLPLFLFDSGHENRLNVDAKQNMYIIARGQRSAVLCTGWDCAEPLVMDTQGKRLPGAKYKGVKSWDEAIQWLRENHAVTGPHVCQSTFKSEPSGHTGIPLTPAPRTQIPAAAAAVPSTPSAPALPPPANPSTFPAAPPTPQTPRGRGRTIRMTPDVVDSFVSTPSTPTRSTPLRQTSVPPTPSSSRPTSVPLSPSLSSGPSISQQQKVPLSLRFEWFVVFSSAQDCPEIFDDIADAQEKMNLHRKAGFRVRVKMGHDVEAILNSWEGF